MIKINQVTICTTSTVRLAGLAVAHLAHPLRTSMSTAIDGYLKKVRYKKIKQSRINLTVDTQRRDDGR